MVSWLSPLAHADAVMAHKRAAHVSTALDVASPIAAVSDLSGQALRLYATHIWPALFSAAHACPSAPALALQRAMRAAVRTMRWTMLLAPLAVALAAAVYLFALKRFFPSIFHTANRHKFPLASSVMVMLFGSMAAVF
jgi:hypothetical protein